MLGIRSKLKISRRLVIAACFFSLSLAADAQSAKAYVGLATIAKGLELQLEHARATSSGQIERAFSDLSAKRADALLVVAEALFLTHRSEIARLALKHRLPSMHGMREMAEAGGLIAYGPSLRGSTRRAAIFADKILRGAKPYDLPVEQPTRFELVVNRTTAKQLALTLPQSLLVRADDVVH